MTLTTISVFSLEMTKVPDPTVTLLNVAWPLVLTGASHFQWSSLSPHAQIILRVGSVMMLNTSMRSLPWIPVQSVRGNTCLMVVVSLWDKRGSQLLSKPRTESPRSHALISAQESCPRQRTLAESKKPTPHFVRDHLCQHMANLSHPPWAHPGRELPPRFSCLANTANPCRDHKRQQCNDHVHASFLVSQKTCSEK